MNLIATDQQKLVQDARVEMFELEIEGQGTLYFSSTSNNGQPLLFGGKEYQPIPIKAEGFEWSGSGTLPRPTLSIAMDDMSFISLVTGNADLVGCPITRIRTYRKYLDDGSNPNPTAMFPVERYFINRKSEDSGKSWSFELTSKQDREGRMVPALQVIRDTCRHRFRKWNGSYWNYTGATCPYAGAAMYDQNGEPTTDPNKAQCGKRLTDCEIHFGVGSVLPMRAFPGVGRI